ncbi:MAG: cation-translocating P-type ATPase [Oscillospiraceae bacterium]|nr:cation-translocating P-type ATPase [Oscillospiraceae bacterium]
MKGIRYDKKINDFLAGLPMTIVGGVFLAASFILRKIGIVIPVDTAWVTVIICGIPLLYLSVWRIIHNKGISKISSALLITVAMIAAICIRDLFAAGEVAFIMEIGAILEDMTTERAKKGLKNLISLTPVQGRLIRDGKEVMISAEEIRTGDILRVLPGETIPADGEITNGETSIDQSIMTGESLPVDKTVGDSVFCGTINRFGAIDLIATKVGEDSSLKKLIKMVADAEKKQAPSQRIADKWASWLVPVALLIAILAYVITGDIVRGVTVMVVFCPCALVLSTPTAIMAGIGQATKHGVIIKSGEALELMGKADTIAFDKTGTLTYGKLEVSEVAPFGEMDSDMLLKLTASAESRSEHPLGKAITNHAQSKNIELYDCDVFRMTAGKGIYAEVGGHKLFCGNEKYLVENGIGITDDVSEKAAQFRNEGMSSVLTVKNGNIIGIIALSDVLRPEAKDMMSKLHALGTKTVLLTGDNKRTAGHFAKEVGISEVRADLLPEEKVANIAELEKSGAVCMIGDGVNDAPALKAASIGVAMGNMGSDIAIDSADIALTTDDLSVIPYLKRLSVATRNTIKTAITISMCINFVAVTLSVLGVLNPTTGALVHNAGSCFVVLIAALLYDRKFD